MHIYRICNSLTLQEYEFNKELNAFFYGELNAANLVDKVGDLSLLYAECVNDSDWIEPHLIKKILLSLDKVKDVNEELSQNILDWVKSNEVTYKPQLLNGFGYIGYHTHTVEEIREIDIYTADEKARNYLSKNLKYKWLNRLNKEDIESIKNIMENTPIK